MDLANHALGMREDPLVGRIRRSLIACRLNQLATQQAAKQSYDGLLRA